MGADEKSISIARPKLTGGKTDQQRRMEMMVRSRMEGGARKEDGPKKEPVILSAALTAEWALPDDFEKVLTDSHAIQEKIKIADMGGQKDLEEKKTEEEEEEEAEEDMHYYGGMEEPKPGDATFVYVSKVSTDEVQKAMTEAFRRCRESATQLAAACGMKLGALMDVSSSTENTSTPDQFAPYRTYMQQQAGFTTPQPDEAISPNPGDLAYTVTINGSFALVP
jgi:hypothetical protein